MPLEKSSSLLISIITPCFNAEKYISETIESVRQQSYQNWEMIIVDDGSKDNSYQLLQDWAAKDPRIKALKQTNAGPALARQNALNHSKGELVCFLDADDLWLPQKLERQLNFMLEKQSAFSFSQYRRFTNNPEQTGRLVSIPLQVSYEQLLSHNVIATLTTMVDRRKTGPLIMANEPYDDFVLWLSILKKGFVALGIQEDLARYRVVMGSVSSKKLRAAKWYWHIIRNVERLPLIVACFQFCKYALKVSLKHSRF